MKRLTLLLGALTAGAGLLCAATVSGKPEIFKVSQVKDYSIRTMSDNGKYGISSTPGDMDTDNPKPAGGALIDLYTRQVTTIEAPSGWGAVGDVTDGGIVVGSEGGKPGWWSPETGKWTTFSVPAGFGGGHFNGVTPDGRIAVGYYIDAYNEFLVSPMAFDLSSGKEIELANLPTKDLSGEDKKQNLFFNITPDGRYAIGQMSQSYLMPVALFSYVYDLQEHTWDPIGYTYDAATGKFTKKVENLHFINGQRMGCQGKYITGTAYMVVGKSELEGGEEYYAPYRYDVETHEIEIFEGSGDKNVSGECVTSDGTLLGSAPFQNPYPTAQVRSGKYFVTLDQILSQVYGISLADHNGDGISGSFAAVSADGLTASMVTYDNSYIIRMPEPFGEAAKRVDLLANYSLDIPSGSQMSAMKELNLTFDRAISVKNQPELVQLKDGQGEVVRNAMGASVAGTNAFRLTVLFRAVDLAPGETYTVTIPEGYVSLADDPEQTNREIVLTYTGRREGAIELLDISPKSGSILTELNSTSDFITATFDAEVAVAANTAGTLYRLDGEEMTPVAHLYCGAVGKQAGFFPGSRVMLYKGSNYRVVIPAGAVTDLSGRGGCEEIVLDYAGAYVRELSPDDKYIYYNNFTNYDRLIYWQGEFNTPDVTPMQWGFTAETPWMLLRSSEYTSDWALTTHSMFSSPAMADKWAIVPQLYIPDGSCHLAFDAQSYLKTKEDRLKVIVYASDAVINYFSESLRDEFLQDGDVVFDKVLSPGKSEEDLEGDWEHVVLPLEKYAGKYVYIAFVNRNTDQSAIFLDNVEVARTVDVLFTNHTPSTVVAQEETEVSGILTGASELETLQGITLTLTASDGTVVSTLSDPEATLGYQDVYNFRFPESLPLQIGYENGYIVKVESGAVSTSYAFTVKDLTFEPEKRVAIEEYTGSGCPNCPLGICAFDNLKRLYGDRVIPVAMHTYGADQYGYGLADYTTYLGLDKVGAPSGCVNRTWSLAPMISTPQGYLFNGRGIVESDGTEAYLWADAVEDLLSEPAEAGIGFTVEYDESTGKLAVDCTVDFAIHSDNRSLRLFGVVTEDDLVTMQQNGLWQVSDPNLGDWGAGGIYGQSFVPSVIADDVCRLVINGESYNGTLLPWGSYVPGGWFKHLFEIAIPSGRISNPENCSVAMLLIDGSTGRVINANKARFNSATSGMETLSSAGKSLALTREGDLVTVQGDGQVTLEAYNAAGFCIGRTRGMQSVSLDLSAAKGVIVVRAAAGDEVKVFKMMR